MLGIDSGMDAGSTLRGHSVSTLDVALDNTGILGFRVPLTPYVAGIQRIRGSYYSIPKAIFYLLKGDYGGEGS